MLTLEGTKALALTVMALLVLVVGLLPLYLRKKLLHRMHQHTSQLVLTGCLCFGAGVLMSTVFLHLLPEAKSSLEYAMEAGYMKEMTYPVTEVVLCSGFFFVYMIEEIIHTWVGHQHSLQEVQVTVTGPATVEEARQAAKVTRASSSRANSMLHLSESHRSLGSTTAVMSIAVHTRSQSLSNKGFEADENSLQDKKGTTGTAEARRHSIHTIPHCHHEHPLSKQTSVMGAVVIVVALSFHSIMEGLAVGLEDVALDVWVLFAALCSHKIVIAFSMSMELLEIGVSLKPFLVSMIIFALASPIGGLIGGLIVALSPGETASGVIIPAVLQGVSGGTILYITFCEVLERERSKPEGSNVRFLALVLGFGVMAGLESIGEHSHEHTPPPTSTTTSTTTTALMLTT